MGRGGKESHFDKYQRITGDKMPFNGNYPDSPGNKYRVYRNGKMVKATSGIQTMQQVKTILDSEFGNPTQNVTGR